MDSITNSLDVNKLMKVLNLVAKIILENGGETPRAEDTITRIAKSFGINEIEGVVMPVGFFITISQDGLDNHTTVKRVKKRTTDLSKLNEANRISRLITEGKLNLDEALKELQELSTKTTSNKWLLLIGSALSSGFFTLLFNGSILDFSVSVFCGAFIQILALVLRVEEMFPLVISLLGSFSISCIATASTLLFPEVSLEAVISGAIMPLLPGLAMTNAIRDTMQGDLISGLVRGTEAMIIAISLAVGAGFGLVLWLFLGGGLG